MNRAPLIATPSITLVASTLAHIRVELEAPEKLAELLNAVVSTEWPTGEYDRDAMEFFRARFEEGGDAVVGWYGWYAVRAADTEAPRTLVGAGGYFGPPDAAGTVEIGYSMLPGWQQRGYATQMVRALVANAFAFATVKRVIAHTHSENTASVAVLLRSGFVNAGAGREPGTMRFDNSNE
jgi:RimJ/RimL family protein N-acetyltransferase